MIRNAAATLRNAVIVICAATAGCRESGVRHADVVSMPTECADCTIDARVVWSSSADDPNVMAGVDYLEVGNTLWIMGEEARSWVIRVDVASGESELIDRTGDGPGEFRAVHRAAVHPSGDTLIVAQDRGISYFTTDLQEVRSVPLVVRPMAMVPLDNGSLVISQSSGGRPRESVGFGLHLVGPDGAYLRSLRPLEPDDRPGGYWIMNRGAEPNTFWVLVPGRAGLVVEQWDGAAMQSLRRFSFSPAWWIGDKPPEVHEQRAGRGQPALRGRTSPVVVHDDGRVLWLGLSHFDEDHATADRSTYTPHRWYDGVLLAMDRDTGGVQAVTVFDEILYGFTRSGKLVLYDEFPNGNPRLRLAEVGLIQR